MSPFLYAINIGTLATWLSVAGFGAFGILVSTVQEVIGPVKNADPLAALESIVLTEDFAPSDTPPVQETETGSTGDAEEVEVPFATEETLPTPPEMPETAEVSQLPEIPDLPSPVAKPAVPTKPLAVPRPSNKAPTRSNIATSATGGSPQGKPEPRGEAGSGGSGMSDANRLAGGRMPRPTYPAEARSKGQTGTVLVEFVVGESGSVISAYAKKSSPWPILNERAVSAVRGWKFKPGSIAKFTMPIVFKLN